MSRNSSARRAILAAESRRDKKLTPAQIWERELARNLAPIGFYGIENLSMHSRVTVYDQRFRVLLVDTPGKSSPRQYAQKVREALKTQSVAN